MLVSILKFFLYFNMYKVTLLYITYTYWYKFLTDFICIYCMLLFYIVIIIEITISISCRRSKENKWNETYYIFLCYRVLWVWWVTTSNAHKNIYSLHTVELLDKDACHRLIVTCSCNICPTCIKSGLSSGADLCHAYSFQGRGQW